MYFLCTTEEWTQSQICIITKINVLPKGGARTVFPYKDEYVQYQSHSNGVMQTQDVTTLITSAVDFKGNSLFADWFRDNYIPDNGMTGFRIGEMKAMLNELIKISKNIAGIHLEIII